MQKDFSTITEAPGVGATQEQLSVLLTRYHLARQYSQGKDVLEVACGTGQGLGYMAQVANTVTGGDIDEKNVSTAKAHYQSRPQIKIDILDAHQLQFPDKSFDLILIYEALYYLERPQAFLDEVKRVLRQGGKLIISSVNKQWKDFNPSPFSTRYFSAMELKNLLMENGFSVEMLKGFHTPEKSTLSKIISLIKRTAVALHLIPKTMKGKELLKRLFLGKLTPLPSEVTDSIAVLEKLIPIQDSELIIDNYKFIYIIADR